MSVIGQADLCTRALLHAQVQCPALRWEPPPTLAGYLDPRPQSWLHEQEGQRLSPSLGAARETLV